MEFEVIIIGGSFAGQSAALQLARARRDVLVIDAKRPRNRFAKEAHRFIGQDGRAPSDIVGTAAEQLARYPTVRQVDRTATDATIIKRGPRTAAEARC